MRVHFSPLLLGPRSLKNRNQQRTHNDRKRSYSIGERSSIPKENIPMLAFGRSETGAELLESFANLIEVNHCNNRHAIENLRNTIACLQIVPTRTRVGCNGCHR